MIDFIGVGVQKSGTTWLYSRLNELPEFSLAPKKELHYFDRQKKYPSPNSLSESSLLKRLSKPSWLLEVCDKLTQQVLLKDVSAFKWYLNYYFSNYNDDWYQSLFSGLPGLKGEITPSYSILQIEDISRMKTIAPNTKLIILLRNPVYRAWSHFRHKHRNNKNFDINNFSTNQIIEFMESDPQVMRSDYVSTISNFKKVYPKSQILIGFYDTITTNPNQLLFEIVTFIGGRTSDIDKFCKVNKVENPSKKAIIPEEVNNYLKTKYKGMIQDLSNTYGGYFTCWYNDLYGENGVYIEDQVIPTTFMP
jgi:hypothetical protein